MNNLIRSIGIIMDGNRRWAKAQGLSTVEGHRRGFEVVKKLASELPRFQKQYGLEYVFFYAFSTENWKRLQSEVGHLMVIFEEAFRWVLSDFVEKGEKDPTRGVRFLVIGQRERFSQTLQTLMKEAEEKTKQFGGVTVVFALSYGGRAEILEAVQKLKAESAPISEETFSNALWSAGIPDPELIIRTGGEQRLSNFLPWQSVYSEFFFPKTLWPDFTVADLEQIFEEYTLRKRNHGA